MSISEVDKQEFTSLLKKKKADMDFSKAQRSFEADKSGVGGDDTRDINVGYKLPRSVEKTAMEKPIPALGGSTLFDVGRLGFLVVVAMIAVSTAFLSSPYQY